MEKRNLECGDLACPPEGRRFDEELTFESSWTYLGGAYSPIRLIGQEDLPPSKYFRANPQLT